MVMQPPFEQQEWHGIARESQEKLDPFTSQLEINTQPGRNKLERLPSRQPYLASRLPLPAVHFTEHGQYLQCLDNTGTALDFRKSATPFVACVCIKWDEISEAIGTTINLLGALSGDTVGWAITLEKSGSDWVAKGEVQDTAGTFEDVTLTTPLVRGSWYWLEMEVGNTNMTVYQYKDGSDSNEDNGSNPGLTRTAFSGTYPLFLGGRVRTGPNDPDETFYKGSIGYACVGTTGTLPDPWQIKIARNGQASELNASFVPYNPSYSVFPAYLDESNPLTWVTYPRPEIEFAECSAASFILDGKGFHSKQGQSYTLSLSDLDLFRKRTVFTFHCDIDGDVDLIRAYNNKFRVNYSYNNGDFSVWTYADTSTSDNLVYVEEATTAGSFAVGSQSDVLLAIEVNPDRTGTAEHIFAYEWASSTWEAITTVGNDTAYLLLNPPDATKWVLGEVNQGEFKLHDFRIIVGDDGWRETLTPTADGLLPTNIKTWLNHKTDAGWAFDRNIATLSFPETSDVTSRVFAASDRVDGVFRYQSNPLVGRHSWDGCEHLENGFLPVVDSVFDDEDGTIAGVTDSFYFVDNTPSKAYSKSSKPRRRVAKIGSRRYITGPQPFQHIGRRTRLVGWPAVQIYYEEGGDATYTAEQGHLSQDTAHKFYLTFYDPETGMESWANGPFSIYPDVANAVAKLTPDIYTMAEISGYEIRYYRQELGSGIYRLEGSSRIIGPTAHGSTFSYTADFIMGGMSETDLALQPQIVLRQEGFPAHIYCTIWNNRAWLVDAVDPSRMRFSSENDVSDIPEENLIWTDEGLTGKVLGAISGFGGLVLLKEGSLWIIPQFQEDAGIQAVELVPEVGCVSADAAVFANGTLWWASPGGIYAFNGQLPVSYSERLEGLDKKVWDHNPRACRAWYDRENFKVVFACDGAGISIDVRSGAAAIVATSDTCYGDISSTSYSGPVYGGAGAVWKEVTGNKGQTLDSSGNLSDVPLGPVSTTAAEFTSAINFNWHDGANSGTERIGARDTNLATTATSFVSASAAVGRLWTQWDKSTGEAWATQIHCVEEDGDGRFYFRTKQTDLAQYFIDRSPYYYESQKVFYNKRTDAKIFERMDLTTGEISGTANVLAQFVSFVHGATASMISSATCVLATEADAIVPVRLRGNYSYYTIEGYGDDSTPEIRSVRTHYRQIRPRGRVR